MLYEGGGGRCSHQMLKGNAGGGGERERAAPFIRLASDGYESCKLGLLCGEWRGGGIFQLGAFAWLECQEGGERKVDRRFLLGGRGRRERVLVLKLAWDRGKEGKVALSDGHRKRGLAEAALDCQVGREASQEGQGELGGGGERESELCKKDSCNKSGGRRMKGCFPPRRGRPLLPVGPAGRLRLRLRLTR